MVKLGNSYFKIGRSEEAVELLEAALSLGEKTFGKGHVNVQNTMHTLAVAYQRNGQLSKAIELMEKTKKLRIETLGLEHPRTLSLLVGLASAYMDDKRFEEGIPLMKEALKSSRNVLGDSHPQTLTTLHNLCGYLMKDGQLEAAEPFLLESVAAQKQNNPNSWMRFKIESLYGELLLQQGKLEESGLALTVAYEGFKRLEIPMGSEDSFEIVLERLKKLAEVKENLEAVEKWSRALEELQKPEN